MGCVLSEEQKQAIEATKVSKQINKSIQEDYKRSLKEVKFLLLGKFQRWKKKKVLTLLGLIWDVLTGM